MSTLGWVLVGMGVTERRKADREKFLQREEQTAHMQHNSHPSLPSLKSKKKKQKEKSPARNNAREGVGLTMIKITV